MYTTPQILPLACHASVTIKADSPFMCYISNEKGEKKSILGPFNNQLVHRFKLPDDEDTIQVVSHGTKKANFEVSWYGGKPRREILDNTPVEVPAGAKAPEALESILARLVNNALVAKQETDHTPETMEELMDFGPEDDDPFDDYEMMKEIEPKERSKEEDTNVSKTGDKAVQASEEAQEVKEE